MRPALVVLVTAALITGACGGSNEPVGRTSASAVVGGGPGSTATKPAVAEPDPAPSTTTTAAPAPAPPTPPAPGTAAPTWLFTRPLPLAANGLGEIRPTPPELVTRRFNLPDTAAPLPGTGWASRVEAVPADVAARSTWSAQCPVTLAQLRYVRVAFHGFDGARHTGELVVNAEAAQDLVSVFGRLWAAGYPLEEMRVTRADELDLAPTGDGNDTGAFTCRPLPGSTHWSQHAYGLAIDVNPFQNPYTKGDQLIPELASAYLDRGRSAPGIIRAGDPVVSAFASVGWEWGGNWRSAKDRMHFSRNGL